MAYRFALGAPLDREARRILIEQIERAEKRLKSTEDRAVAVHEARKNFKRVRALLRLLRPAIGKQAFRAENADFRETARLLAGARDAFVLGQTVARLEAWHGLDPVADTAALRAALATLPQAAAAGPGSAPVKEAMRRLKAAKGRIARLPIEVDGVSGIAAGLERCYGEALQARAAAVASGSNEAFHEWRKRVQQHWRHMGLLAKAWPDYFNARIRIAKRLSATLGDDHDLAMLIAFVDSQPPDALKVEQRRSFVRLARKSQGELRRAAAIDADILLADGARGLARRVESYWSAAAMMRRANDPASSEATGEAEDAEGPKGAVTQADEVG